MYAQAFDLTGHGRTDCLSRVVSRELVPSLRTEPGFCGALSLVDRATADALLIVFWETEEEAARPLLPCFEALLDALGVADPSTCEPRVWEVGARA